MGKHERHTPGYDKIQKQVDARTQRRIRGMSKQELTQLEQALKDEEDFPSKSGELDDGTKREK